MLWPDWPDPLRRPVPREPDAIVVLGNGGHQEDGLRTLGVAEDRFVIEREATTTWENADLSAPLLKALGGGKLLLNLMNPEEIKPLVLTWNEEPNPRRCLEGLRWASRIVVVGSGSSDGTLAICTDYPNVEVVTRPFDNHTAQWNHGLGQVATPWVLSLDADYLVGTDFVAFVYTLFAKEAILDGFLGWFYALQRTHAERLLSLVLLGKRLRK